MSPSVTAILPAYKEEGLTDFLLSLGAFLPDDYELVVVVDDEDTAFAAECAASVNPSVRVVRRPRRTGVGSAFLDGVRLARGNIVATMNVDYQHPPELLPKLVERVRAGCDLVVASRYAKGGSVKAWSSLRRLISVVATGLARALLPKSRCVKDPMSGFFAVKRAVLDEAGRNHPSLKPGAKPLLEVLTKGRYSSVEEVPYAFAARKWGKSKMGVGWYASYLKQLLRLMLETGEWKRLGKFSSVGAIGVLVNMGLLLLLVEHGRMLPALASPLAVLAGTTHNFTWNELWTFKDMRFGGVRGALGRYPRFVLARLGGIAVNVSAVAVLTFLGFHYMLANLVGIGSAFQVNYVLSLAVVWRGEPRQHLGPSLFDPHSIHLPQKSEQDEA